MNNGKVIRIGFVGLGTVGQGVWKHLEKDGSELERRLGARIELHSAAVGDLARKRAIAVPADRLTADAMSVATDPEVDILCELMGGETLAKEVTLAALKHGKIVVTANKALICKYGEELFEAARQGGGQYFFEASVAGGIPIIKSLREGLVANRFPLIYGILNGTCNYILTRMERERLGFEVIVKEAKELGYVEADEGLDLDGWDTAHKIVILAYLAHGKWVDLDDVHVQGIRNVTIDDIVLAHELGDYKLKLLGIITRDFETNRLALRVHPTLIPERKVLARVDEVYNGVSVTGDVVGTTVHIGRGAGQDATASAVISDIADAVMILLGKRPTVPEMRGEAPKRQNGDELALATLEEIPGKFYLRMTVRDRPGVLAEISSTLARHDISIESVRQQPRPEQTASLILTTHTSNEHSMQGAMRELRKMDAVDGEPFILRIADFDD